MGLDIQTENAEDTTQDSGAQCMGAAAVLRTALLALGAALLVLW